MKKHSIVFCGTPDFAVPSLRALVTSDVFDVQLVITQPDRPVGRSKELLSPPVKNAARELGIPVLQPEKLNAEFPTIAASIDRPDFLVVVAYGQLLSQAILDWPRLAPINVHGSLLPRWRGASPVEHAILNGDTDTGIAVQRMVKELDAGPLLGMTSTTIGERETARTLRTRLSTLGAALLVETLSKPLTETPQPVEGITICRKLSRDDGKADTTTMTAKHIDRLVRALNPWPSVTAIVSGREVKILETSLEPTENSTAVACAEGTTVHILMVQEAGKKAMTGAEWARGIRS